MSEQLIKRIKSLLWRAAGIAVVGGGAYVLQLGDIYKVDPKVLLNIVVIAAIGLIVNEVTKFLNTEDKGEPI